MSSGEFQCADGDVQSSTSAAGFGALGGVRSLAAFGALAALAFAAVFACEGTRGLDFEAEKEINHNIPASEVQLLDLRFRRGAVELIMSEDSEIRIRGKIYVTTTDQATARLKKEKVDLVITTGELIIVSLPEDGEDFAYEAELTVAVPRGIDLRVVVGEGNIETNMILPDRTSVQVGDGEIRMHLPRDFSAQIRAKSNMGSVEVEGFDHRSGEPRRQLIYSEFDGAIGMQWLGGKRIDASANNRGNILIEAVSE